MIASGTHATDGIVCRPVIIEPIAARSTFTRATAMPTTPPMSIATTKPCAPRRSVTHDSRRAGRRGRGRVASNTVNGDGTTYSGFQLEPHDDLPDADDDRDREQLGPRRGPGPRPNAARLGADARAVATRASMSVVDGHGTTSSRSWSVIVAASVATSVRVDAAGPRDRRRCRPRRRGRAGSRAARRSRRGAPPRARCASRR